MKALQQVRAWVWCRVVNLAIVAYLVNPHSHFALSVLFSYWFAYHYWHDLGKSSLPGVVKECMRGALVFLVLSSMGPFLLAYSMSHNVGEMQFYYNAIYLYLHFQYNGWFTFGVMGLFFFAANRQVLPCRKREVRGLCG